MSVQILPFRRPGIAVGHVALPNRVVLAPMSGITDAPFRRLVASGYTDAARRLGRGLVPTWPFDGRPVPRVTLDHVLVQGLHVYDFATYPNPGSDHRAIYAEVGLP